MLPHVLSSIRLIESNLIFRKIIIDWHPFFRRILEMIMSSLPESASAPEHRVLMPIF